LEKIWYASQRVEAGKKKTPAGSICGWVQQAFAGGTIKRSASSIKLAGNFLSGKRNWRRLFLSKNSRHSPALRGASAPASLNLQLDKWLHKET
jgi:hypothetical protein